MKQKVVDIMKYCVERLSDFEVEKVTGGSLESSEEGFKVFNSVTGEDFGIYKDYSEAVQVAKENKISAMGTWGDTEVPFGLVGSGFNRETVRVEEDRTHKANRVYGTGSFEK